MRILGIDPGSVASGFGVVDEEGNRIFFVEAGRVTASSRLSFPHRLKKMYEGLGEVIARHKPDAVAVENVFFAKNVQSALKLGHARGVALLAAANLDLPIFEYTPTEIKQAVVGYGGADKAQVQQMVKTLLKLNKLPEPFDASDALACAICHIHSSRMKETILSRPSGSGRKTHT
ncbi:MAG: crossover junction endodeoxyribonuclease RuvC [Nitrospirota bacterium]